jgi:hypothetical protein
MIRIMLARLAQTQTKGLITQSLMDLIGELYHVFEGREPIRGCII